MKQKIIKRRLDEPQMNIPEGYTCGDCLYYPFCRGFIGRNELDERCDWSPSRFSVIVPINKREN
jgi:hypothetical protein